MKTIKELLQNRNIYTVKTGTSVADAVSFMAEHNIGLVPVLDDEGKLVGVFSERDLVKRVIAKGLNINSTKIDDVMTRELVLADINESHQECLKKMKDKGTRHLLIIENGKLAGILAMRDLLEFDLTVQKETIEVLHNYIYAK
ncbi:putative signal-transduction protein with CBS domains [Melioribacter roseus P3M-2]|uniref:Putative signal-transduction protein with CBS domains n=1 Tax=Melioribacter roseus (strain DSM 23840 / JCM 17771 / VKM B-2668 / P3M-2) TaxID=1191523 RepID=I6YTT8_MELRP|nr:CBS domain-containing protein [Melioribacter roseus]AFN73922.1 putative signal-transduction protein with CBS domains [Melioribacter roseus P3M-2]